MKRVASAAVSGRWPISSKISLGLAKAITLAAASVGIAAFVFGVMDWKKLDAAQQAQVIIGGTQVFAQLLGTVLRKGTAYTTIFRTENTWGSFFKSVWSNDVLELANTRGSNGFSRWLVRDASLEAKLLKETAARWHTQGTALWLKAVWKL